MDMLLKVYIEPQVAIDAGDKWSIDYCNTVNGSFDLTNYPDGLYFFKINTQTIKFIKN